MKKACLTNATTRKSFMGIVETNKFLMLLMALLFIGGADAFAQKKNINIAKAKIEFEPRDTKGAKEAILLALKDTTTNKLANTWFVAGEVFWNIYEEQQKIVWNQPGQPNAADRGLMGEALKKALEYYAKADSLDRLPDKKGRVKPKFTDKIVTRSLSFQRAFPEVGAYFYKQKDYMKAIDMFEQYMRYPRIPYLKGRGLEKDSLMMTLKFNSGISATYADRMDIAAKYFEEIKDTIDNEEDRAMIYYNLSKAYTSMKDTSNMLRIYQLGARRFPKEPFYTTSLINHYIAKKSFTDALTWINSSLKQDEKNAALWNIKGRIINEDVEKGNQTDNTEKLKEVIACYEKSIELDPNLAEAQGSLGRIYYNKAVEELQKVNEIKDDKKYKAEKVKLKVSFEKARPYFEKAHELKPNDRDYIMALRGIYYNLDNDAKYKEMEQLFNKAN